MENRTPQIVFNFIWHLSRNPSASNYTIIPTTKTPTWNVYDRSQKLGALAFTVAVQRASRHGAEMDRSEAHGVGGE